MRIKDILEKNERGFALEFFPPKTAEGREPFLKVVNELETYGPLYMSVTYGAGGTTRDRTIGALRWLRENSRLPLMSHLTCIGATRDSIGAIVDELETGGVENILALRGDPPRGAAGFDPSKGEFLHARDLVAFLKETGHFSIAVAVYPEGHRESADLEKDLEYTKQKIDAGADVAITQMFFENRYFYRFRERAAKAGITIPIIPGIMPIVDCSRIRELTAVCSATVPKDILERLELVTGMPEAMRKMGVEFAVRQVRDLMKHGVNYFHFYTMNRVDSVREILEAAGLVGQRAAIAA